MIKLDFNGTKIGYEADLNSQKFKSPPIILDVSEFDKRVSKAMKINSMQHIFKYIKAQFYYTNAHHYARQFLAEPADMLFTGQLRWDIF